MRCEYYVLSNNIIMDDQGSDYRDRHFSLADGISKKKAQSQLKSSLQHVDMMRNRLKVLTSQAEYNKFRQKYQTQMIQKHNSIHQQLIKTKEEVQNVVKGKNRGLILKETNEKMKKQLKERLGQVFDRLRQEKEQKGKELKQSSQKNRQFLRKRKLKELQLKKVKRQEVLKMQQSIKQTISRYNEQKIRDLSTIRSLQKQSYIHYSHEMMKQLQQLSNQQKVLINQNSQSLKSSRILNHQYNQLYGKNGGRSFQLPGIKKNGNRNHSHTTEADTQ